MTAEVNDGRNSITSLVSLLRTWQRGQEPKVSASTRARRMNICMQVRRRQNISRRRHGNGLPRVDKTDMAAMHALLSHKQCPAATATLMLLVARQESFNTAPKTLSGHDISQQRHLRASLTR